MHSLNMDIVTFPCAVWANLSFKKSYNSLKITYTARVVLSRTDNLQYFNPVCFHEISSLNPIEDVSTK